jgi:hypothetical protein
MTQRPPRRRHRLLLACGTLPLVFGLYGMARGLETRAWPATEAVVLASRLDLSADRDGHDRATVGVRFRYVVDGVEHVASGVERGDLGLQNSAAARRWAKDWPPGTTLDAVYDPADPADAYLVRGVSGPAKMLTAIGAALWLAGLVVFRIERRAKRTVPGRRRLRSVAVVPAADR